MSGLTERETVIVKCLASSIPSKAIAQRLGISLSTVEYHRTNALRKLGFGWFDLAGLTRFAIRKHLINLSDPPQKL